MEQSLKDRITQIEERLSQMPLDLELKDFTSPVFIKDPKHDKRMIADPSGATQVSRTDLVSKSDPKQVPFLHVHGTPDHLLFNPQWREHMELVLNLIFDLRFLIQLQKENQNESL